MSHTRMCHSSNNYISQSQSQTRILHARPHLQVNKYITPANGPFIEQLQITIIITVAHYTRTNSEVCKTHEQARPFVKQLQITLAITVAHGTRTNSPAS